MKSLEIKEIMYICKKKEKERKKKHNTNNEIFRNKRNNA